MLLRGSGIYGLCPVLGTGFELRHGERKQYEKNPHALDGDSRLSVDTRVLGPDPFFGF